MKQLRFTSILLLSACLSGLAGQRVQLQNTHERLICVVPVIGTGAYDDPRRPMYVPAPGSAPAADGIIAFSQQFSDDGRFALVELVARDRAAFKAIFDEKRPDVKVFEKGKHKKDEIEKELRRYKRELDLDKLHVAVP